MDDIIYELYITGRTELAKNAIENLKQFCKDHHEEQCGIEIINLLEKPQLAEEKKIVGTPLLIRTSPLPERKIIGDLSDTDKLLFGLGMA